MINVCLSSHFLNQNSLLNVLQIILSSLVRLAGFEPAGCGSLDAKDSYDLPSASKAVLTHRPLNESPVPYHLATGEYIWAGQWVLQCSTIPNHTPRARLHCSISYYLFPKRFATLLEERLRNQSRKWHPYGTGSRGRTDTVLLPTDFESVASAYFAIPAY